MTLRAGHGRGRGVPRVEVLPPDELPPASPGDTVPSERDSGGRFRKGNTVARMAKVRPGPQATGLDTASDAFRPFLRWGRRYASHRRSELAKAHGGTISAGVGALVESAALALAASRYLHTVGSQTGDPETLKRASTLGNDARQNELAAWELASREAAARPKGDDVDRVQRLLRGEDP